MRPGAVPASYPPEKRKAGTDTPARTGFPGRPRVPTGGPDRSAHPQPRKPWFHAPTGFWCAQIAGKRHYLDRDPGAAQRKLKKLLQDQKRGDAAHRKWLDAYFADLADEFLDDVQARKKPATYRSYHEMLELAQKHLGTCLRVGEFRNMHLTKLEGALTSGYSPTTVFKALQAVQRVFNWAVQNDLLESSPLAGYAKPKPRERTRTIDADEFRMMLRGSSSPFRRLLLALRLTGARPGELRDLHWREVHLDVRLGDAVEGRGFIILPEHKTATRMKHPRPRIIPLPTPIRKMLRVLARGPHGPDDCVFLNTDGNPWTRTALHSQMRRLRERMKLQQKGGESIVLYSARHSFATANVGRVSDIELADLMGHTNISTTRRYTHVSLERLGEIRRRADR